MLFSLSASFSQDILWERSYGGKHAEFLYDAIPTPDYGFLLAGSSISNKNGNKTEANKVNGNTRGVNGNQDLFKEKDGTVTNQTLTPNASGGLNITKTKAP